MKGAKPTEPKPSSELSCTAATVRTTALYNRLLLLLTGPSTVLGTHQGKRQYQRIHLLSNLETFLAGSPCHNNREPASHAISSSCSAACTGNELNKATASYLTGSKSSYTEALCTEGSLSTRTMEVNRLCTLKHSCAERAGVIGWRKLENARCHAQLAQLEVLPPTTALQLSLSSASSEVHDKVKGTAKTSPTFYLLDCSRRLTIPQHYKSIQRARISHP
jgi:hypothetical protein